jgi:hypothetical protein
MSNPAEIIARYRTQDVAAARMWARRAQQTARERQARRPADDRVSYPVLDYSEAELIARELENGYRPADMHPATGSNR